MSKCVAASQHRVVTVDLPFILFCSTFLRCWRLISRQFLCGPRLTRSFRRDIQRFIILIKSYVFLSVSLRYSCFLTRWSEYCLRHFKWTITCHCIAMHVIYTDTHFIHFPITIQKECIVTLHNNGHHNWSLSTFCTCIQGWNAHMSFSIKWVNREKQIFRWIKHRVCRICAVYQHQMYTQSIDEFLIDTQCL